MNPHQRCGQAKVKNWNEPKQVKPKCVDIRWSLQINVTWTIVTGFTIIFDKTCAYITFKSEIKHRQLSYG